MCLSLAWACAAAPPASAPAAIIDSTPAGRADIRKAVASALGTDVLVAKDALTTSNLLVIEPRRQQSIEGRVGGGRIMTPPDIFRLVLVGDRCVLVHARTGAAYPLENTRCRASPIPPGDSAVSAAVESKSINRLR